MRYQLIIFDWDGTVMDSVPRIVSCVRATATECGLQIPSTAAIHDIIGLSLSVALQRLFNCEDEAHQTQLIDVYREHYVTKDSTPSPLFTGVLDVFQALRSSGYQLAVATGKARPGLKRAWLETDTADFFVSSCCAGEAPSKPNPTMLHNILNETGITPEQALMVGDSVHDLDMAQSAGIDAIGVTCGVHDAARLQTANPVHILRSVAELPAWLKRSDVVTAQHA